MSIRSVNFLGEADATKNFGRNEDGKRQIETQNKYRDTEYFWKPRYNSRRKNAKSEIAWTHLSDVGVYVNLRGKSWRKEVVERRESDVQKRESKI